LFGTFCSRSRFRRSQPAEQKWLVRPCSDKNVPASSRFCFAVAHDILQWCIVLRLRKLRCLLIEIDFRQPPSPHSRHLRGEIPEPDPFLGLHEGVARPCEGASLFSWFKEEFRRHGKGTRCLPSKSKFCPADLEPDAAHISVFLQWPSKAGGRHTGQGPHKPVLRDAARPQPFSAGQLSQSAALRWGAEGSAARLQRRRWCTRAVIASRALRRHSLQQLEMPPGITRIFVIFL